MARHPDHEITVVDDGHDHQLGGSDRREPHRRAAARPSADMIDNLRLVDGQAGLDDRVWTTADLSEYLRLVGEASDEFGDVAAVACSLVDRRGDLQVVAWSNDEVLDLERLQLRERQGPGEDCYATSQPVVDVGRTEARRRWPTISTSLVEAGLGSVHALPLRVRGRVIGVLSLYFVEHRMLRAHELRVCRGLLHVAGVRLRHGGPAGHRDGDLRPSDNRYQLGELIGRGGMADVHLARGVDRDRVVAIKTPRVERISEPGLVERFRREGHTAARLDHPSIVSVIGTGDFEVGAPGRAKSRHPYIVMEHVAGVTLRTLVGVGGGLEVDEALRITGDILCSLSYIHDQGVVHGDLSATNVMLSTAGDIKLMDFGSSHAVTGADEGTTQSSDVTPGYGSPERAEGRPCDTRADLYSVGCVLYELLTGRAPFVGDSRVDLAYRHVHEAPRPPSTHRPGVIGAALDTVVLRALAKAPDARYQSALEFRVDLLAAGLDASRPDVEAGAA